MRAPNWSTDAHEANRKKSAPIHSDFNDLVMECYLVTLIRLLPLSRAVHRGHPLFGFRNGLIRDLPRAMPGERLLSRLNGFWGIAGRITFTRLLGRRFSGRLHCPTGLSTALLDGCLRGLISNATFSLSRQRAFVSTQCNLRTEKHWHQKQIRSHRKIPLIRRPKPFIITLR